VWEHLQTCKAKVEIDGLWQPTDSRERDIVIMESLIASGRFTNKDLKEINYCRIYLQVLYLSYITNIKGDKIAAWAVRGHKIWASINMGMARTINTNRMEGMESSTGIFSSRR
jgi:hypothetical protein